MWRKMISLLCSLGAVCSLLCGCEEPGETVSLDDLLGETAGEAVPGGSGELSETGQLTADQQSQTEQPAAGQQSLSEQPAAGQQLQAEASAEPQIYVHVCGAVVRPGVVALAEGSRAVDAVEAAGGFCQNAKADYVNLAAFVKDGEQLYISTVEEAQGRQDAGSNGDSGSESTGTDAGSGRVNLNTADIVLLCTLPGIGESRAADIIAYREEKGGFRTIEEIMKVPGIKEGTFGKLKDLITAK